MTTDRESEPPCTWIRNEAPCNAAPTSARGTSSETSHSVSDANGEAKGPRQGFVHAHGGHREAAPGTRLRDGGTGSHHALTAAFEREFQRDGRLRELHWFRTDWQRGGAATANALLRSDAGDDVPVVLKIPVVPRELRWSRRLGVTQQGARDADSHEDPPVARLIDSGSELGPYDFAWVLLERVPHGPMALDWHPNTIARIAEAAARFHLAASRTPVDEAPLNEDWESLVRSAREHVRDPAMPERSRWSNALKEFSRRLDRVVERWSHRAPIGWIHGDLHPANALTRQASQDAPACLIDLADVRAGHWLEDAVYLERLLWTRPERLAQKPVKAIADARKRHGLDNGDYPALAGARRLLLAATTPAFRGEHNHVLLAASLARLEEGLKGLK